MSKNEDITMTLGVYHKDAGRWASNLAGTGELLSDGSPISLAQANTKVKEVTDFLKYTGGW